MATTDRQKFYNQRYREKRAKIQGLSRELDRQVLALEHLPKYAACGPATLCEHTSDRRNQLQTVELVRARLQALEH